MEPTTDKKSTTTLIEQIFSYNSTYSAPLAVYSLAVQGYNGVKFAQQYYFLSAQYLI